MKMLIVTGLLIVSQFAFAQVRRMSVAEARSRVERSSTFKEIDAAKKGGKDIMRDPRLMDRISKMMELTLKDVVTLSGSQNNSLMKLIAISPRDIIAEGARLASIAKDPASSAHEKATARKAIDLIIKAASTVDVIAVNAAAEARQQAKITKIIEVSEKIAGLEFGQSSKTFVAKYERALQEGKSVEEAVRLAADGKFTEKQLRECE